MLDNGRESIVIIDASMMSRSVIETCRKNEDTAEEGYQLWKFRFIERIFWYLVEFKPVELVIAIDSPPYWRKDIFKYYKAHRKVDRERDERTSDDWFKYEEYFKIMEEFFMLLKKSFPFKFISYPRAEADDIAGVLCGYEKLYEYNKILITTDQDFLQLQMKPNVYLYNPIKRVFMNSDNPKTELLLKICQGDDGDFIPSIQNVEKYKDTFLDFCVEELQISDSRKGVEVLLEEDEEKFYDATLNFRRKYGLKSSRSMKIKKTKCLDLISTHTLNEFLEEDGNEQIKNKFKRNNKLINLSVQPKDIKNGIIKEYNMPLVVGKIKLYEFILKNRFQGLSENISVFQDSLKLLKKV
jgi:5'-3' exonuclease